MAKARHSRLDCTPGCAVEAAVSLIDGKWKAVALFHLEDGPIRFNELRRRVGEVTPRMLTNQLRELEADGLIEREVFAQVPPRVEYRLSQRGQSLTPIIAALKAWGDANMDLFGRRREAGLPGRD
ncbi:MULTISPECIES: helix-turn-helix domain-containing protein [unclassified Novosphingobium]|uniref:winged helix-turn-helix transcriptional regulator n=1 Tax=unclassified Novosphingobium TaxID=2644732 RepID=UPI00146A670E|nr:MULTISPECIES: helix-turn-helix domain-containing protein [unclassified Novosphingobium]NMN04954.1 DNA-binding HxlR family transcriptional regulator [Novosphingobium sp. SG919]NMN87247.1 DNA-binding HxlR family transcriptional regulator [Novosphingobium sp. SG916]